MNKKCQISSSFRRDKNSEKMNEYIVEQVGNC